MFWPLARILSTMKEGSGCLTQLGREGKREREKEKGNIVSAPRNVAFYLLSRN